MVWAVQCFFIKVGLNQSFIFSNEQNIQIIFLNSCPTGFWTRVSWRCKQMTYPLCYDAPRAVQMFVPNFYQLLPSSYQYFSQPRKNIFWFICHIQSVIKCICSHNTVVSDSSGNPAHGQLFLFTLRKFKFFFHIFAQRYSPAQRNATFLLHWNFFD